MTAQKEYEIVDTTSIIGMDRVILKVEKDQWGILYDPEADISFSINHLGIFIWKLVIDNPKITIKHIVAELNENWADVPAEAEDHVMTFIKLLLEKGLVEMSTNGLNIFLR